jgi:alpha-mannosidase
MFWEGIVRNRLTHFGALLFAVSLCLVPGAEAQSHAVASYQLSARGQAALNRLSQLNSIPASDWIYRAGDLPQAESADLDTSGWQGVVLPFRASTETVWLRRWVTIPQSLNGYDPSGARVWFHLSLESTGPGPEYAYQLLYIDGVRVAEGQHVERRVLFAHARPGEKVLIAVKLLATQYEKSIEAAELTLDAIEGRPSPDDLLKEIQSAAQVLPAVATSREELDAQEQTLEFAAAQIDMGALDRNDQSAFDVSLGKAQAALGPLKPLLQKLSVDMTGNAHIDAAWLWTKSETVDQVHFTFADALRLMNEYPQYTFAQSTSQYSEWMEEKFPEVFKGIQQRVKEGRWELVGGMWVEPDFNLPDGEAEVRQLLVGTRYLHSRFGVDVQVGWNPDSFGYSWQLPQVYKKSGIDFFLTQKMVENEVNPLPLKLFWWQAPDGSRVLTYIPHDYVLDIDPVDIASDLARAVKMNPGEEEMLHLHGPSYGRLLMEGARAVLDTGEHWAQPDKVYPAMHFGTAERFFRDAASRIAAESPVWSYRTAAEGNVALPQPPAGEITVPTWKDELYLEHHRGTYTTQAAQKRNIRESEEWVLNAEKYSSLGWLYGGAYPAERLTEAWKKILFNDFHDLAAGSGIGAIYKDAQRDFDEVRWLTDEASSQSLTALDAGIDTRGAGQPIVIWNPLGWDRGGVVKLDVQMPEAETGGISVLDAAGKTLAIQVISQEWKTNTYSLLVSAPRVPAMGYTVLHAVSGRRRFATDLKASGLTLENAHLRVTVDAESGCITSLYDKQSQFESLAAGSCGNQLQAIHDLPKADDAWNIDEGTLDHFTPITHANAVELVERGPLRAAIRVTHNWQSSKFVQEIALDAGSDQVDVVDDIDWHETHILLKAAFTLAASRPMATYEIPYGTIERPTTRNNSWEQAKFEVPALRWADLGDGKHGFSLINESKYGYDCRGNVLRLSLLRSPVWPDPDADRGRQHFSYALYPHAGDWKSALTVRHGYEYNYRLQARASAAHAGALPASHSFVRVEPANLVLTAMKKAEDGDGLILRFYEWAGEKTEARIEAPPGATAAYATNLMEKIDRDAARQGLVHRDAGGIHLSVEPYSIDTLRVDFGKAASVTR